MSRLFHFNRQQTESKCAWLKVSQEYEQQKTTRNCGRRGTQMQS